LIRKNQIAPGVFIRTDDPKVKLPDHRRIFVIESFEPADGGDTLLSLRSVSGEQQHTELASSKYVSKVRTLPDLHADADCLVGHKARIHHHSGSAFVGLITGVTYTEVAISSVDGPKVSSRQVDSIELDRSGSNTWEWATINHIELLS